MQYTLWVHILTGAIALVSGGLAIGSKKGNQLHRKAGNAYFYGMTVVFCTGLVIAAHTVNEFLFLIAFLTYYSIFAGVRILKLKQLHKGQKPKWYDWFAGGVNGAANLIFICFGIYLLRKQGWSGGSLLTLGFGIGGLLLTYINLKPFVFRPTRTNHWYVSHMGNMIGGYIATLTSFFSTIVTRYEFMDPFLAFALPSMIGVPLLIYWTRREEKRYDMRHQTKGT